MSPSSRQRATLDKLAHVVSLFLMLVGVYGREREWINSQGFLRHIRSMLQIAGKDNKGCGY
jgi:hypothetical protein